MILEVRDTNGRLVYRFKGRKAVELAGILLPDSRKRRVKDPEPNSKYYEYESDTKFIVPSFFTGEIEIFFIKGYFIEIIN